MHRLAAGFRSSCLLVLLTLASMAAAADPSRVLPPGQKPDDIRLKPQRTLNDKYHPWSPPESKAEWEQQAELIRRQLLVSNGLWPLPDKTPLNAVVHGLADRGDYTVEKVIFVSRPGVYVTGSLYRPKDAATGKRPGILCPHGHWENGRFYDAGEKGAASQFKLGAETYLSGAHSPLQARMVQLARMGCVVFFYDMVGIADNTALPHRDGFNDVAAELWLQNKMGLQTWNSIRAVDFLESLPDVDPQRIAVTGASGGGTQTFMLCALDPRPAVAFPAVMVGTAMQGGCQCENASYLRHGINNVAIAALTAPRPLAMTGANDWTIDIESKGLPELKRIYGFYGKADLVDAKCFPQFPHNYNETSREVMYAWMARHLGLEGAAIEQSDFWPMTRDDLTVFDDKHSAPSDWLNAEQLREEMTKESKAMMASIAPKDASGLERYRQVVGEALDVMLGRRLAAESIKVTKAGSAVGGIEKMIVSAAGRSVPAVVLAPTEGNRGETVLWLDGRGKSHLFDETGEPRPVVQTLRQAGFRVASADLFLTGEFVADGEKPVYPVNSSFPGYTFGYNAPLIAHRVRDLVMVRDALTGSDRLNEGTVHLIGTGDAGLWTLLAQAQMRSPGIQTIVDLNQFTFENVKDVGDQDLLPGALRYGGVIGAAALIAPSPLTIHRPANDLKLLFDTYLMTGAVVSVSTNPLGDDVILKTLIGR